MDVGDEGDPDPGLDRPEGPGGLAVRHGQADDLRPGPFEPADLGRGGRDVPRVRLGHGLDDDGRAAADGDAPDADPAGRAALEHGRPPFP